jgi:hypothetical protein
MTYHNKTGVATFAGLPYQGKPYKISLLRLRKEVSIQSENPSLAQHPRGSEKMQKLLHEAQARIEAHKKSVK